MEGHVWEPVSRTEAHNIGYPDLEFPFGAREVFDAQTRRGGETRKIEIKRARISGFGMAIPFRSGISLRLRVKGF
jgi:hypothetical protein